MLAGQCVGVRSKKVDFTNVNSNEENVITLFYIDFYRF